MKIVLLAHNLSVGGGLTVGREVTSTLPSLLPDHQFLISCPAGVDYSDTECQPNVEVIRPPKHGLSARFAWERGSLRDGIDAFEPNWIFGLGNLAFQGFCGRQSVLLHDPHHVYPSDTFGQVSLMYRLKKWTLKQLFRRSLKKVESVYVQTNTIRNRFCHQYEFPRGKVHLLPPACSPRKRHQGQFQNLDDTLGVGSFKLLYISAPWGHKNHKVLVDTFKLHKKRMAGVCCFITVDPEMNSLGRAIVDRIEDEGLGGQIISLGHLNSAEVQAAYGDVDALIFPSLLETAGLPLIEAMEHGLPVLASDLDYAQELCGDAACFFDPCSPDSVADAIIRIRDDSTYRGELARRSAARFEQHVRTWDEVLEDVIRIEGLREAGGPCMGHQI